MLAPADVKKIATKFVYDVIAYFKKRNYVIDSKLDKTSFYDFVMATELEDCLSYEDECKLKEASKNINIADAYPTINIPCSDQINTVLSIFSQECSLEPLSPTPFNFGAFPRINLANNSYNHPASISFTMRNTCGGSKWVTVQTGNLALGPYQPSAFSSSYHSVFRLTATMPITYDVNANDGCLTMIELWSTGSSGSGLSYQQIDVRPSTANTLWGTCPTCTPINTSHLYFGSSNTNFNIAFKGLLSNISRTLYGANFFDPNMAVQLLKNNLGISTAVLFQTNIRHNPNTRFLSIIHGASFPSRYRWSASVSKGVESERTISANNGIKASFLTGFMASVVNYDILPPCTKMAMISTNNLGNADINQFATAFNLVTLNSPFTTLSPTIEYETSPCVRKFIVAQITPSQGYSYAWYSPTAPSVVASTTNTIEATVSGIYTLVVTTPNNCVYTYTYDYNPGPL
jgi:hypothetical protein